MDRSGVEAWMAQYRRAWSSDDPQEIAALFTEDATYSPYPWPREKNRWEGRDTIVQRWIGHGDSKLNWRFEHEILAVDGDTAVIEGWTDYDDEAYANVWLIRFADDGRAREFREWWVQKPAGD
jgi:ketosteroid isomerase-like protein